MKFIIVAAIQNIKAKKNNAINRIYIIVYVEDQTYWSINNCV